MKLLKYREPKLLPETAEPSNGHMVCDLANREFAEFWYHQFSGLELDLKRSEYCGCYTAVHGLNDYLGMAYHYNFAIPGKECVTWWKDFIKRTKPQSPTRRVYYEHISLPTRIWHYDKDFNIIVSHTPYYQSYGGNGFGRVPMHTSPIGGQWINRHRTKYPDGIIPEQAIEIVRVKP